MAGFNHRCTWARLYHRIRTEQKSARVLERIDATLLSAMHRPDLPKHLAHIFTHAPHERGTPTYGWSAVNRLLLWQQGSLRAATREEWRSLGRRVLPDHSRLLVVGPTEGCTLPRRPRYGDTSGSLDNRGPSYVYDYADTEGPRVDSCEQVRPHLDLAPLSAPTLLGHTPVPTPPNWCLASPTDEELFGEIHARTHLVGGLLWEKHSWVDPHSLPFINELAAAAILEALGTSCPCRKGVLEQALRRHSLVHRQHLGSSASVFLELSMACLEVLFSPLALPSSGYTMKRR